MNGFRAALAAVLGVVAVSGFGQAANVPAAIPARPPEVITQELRLAEESSRKLKEEEAGIMTNLQSQALLPTNVVEAAGGDAELAAKMNRIQELQAELRQLQKEVMPRLAASPVLQERRRQQEKPRARLGEIHKERVGLERKMKALKAELKSMKPSEPAVK